METELRRIEELVSEIVNEMDYLRTREQKLRDTNESTNERVKWFAFGTMGMLVGLGAWQVIYLRAYFRYVVVHLKLTCGTLAKSSPQVETFDLKEKRRSSKPGCTSMRTFCSNALDFYIAYIDRGFIDSKANQSRPCPSLASLLFLSHLSTSFNASFAMHLTSGCDR